MAKTVSTGWRNVTPGACFNCGSDDDFHFYGGGTVYCGCECCPDCGEFNGHDSACAELRRLRDEAQDEANEIEVADELP